MKTLERMAGVEPSPFGLFRASVRKAVRTFEVPSLYLRYCRLGGFPKIRFNPGFRFTASGLRVRSVGVRSVRKPSCPSRLRGEGLFPAYVRISRSRRRQAAISRFGRTRFAARAQCRFNAR